MPPAFVHPCAVWFVMIQKRMDNFRREMIVKREKRDQQFYDSIQYTMVERLDIISQISE